MHANSKNAAFLRKRAAAVFAATQTIIRLTGLAIVLPTRGGGNRICSQVLGERGTAATMHNRAKGGHSLY